MVAIIVTESTSNFIYTVFLLYNSATVFTFNCNCTYQNYCSYIKHEENEYDEPQFYTKNLYCLIYIFAVGVLLFLNKNK